MIDLMHDFEKFVRFEAVLLHQSAHGGAVAPIIVLLQPERFVVGDFEKVDDVIANALVDLLPEIEMMRIERVVEIEHPGLDMFKTGIADAVGAAYCLYSIAHIALYVTRCCHNWRRRGRILANHFENTIHKSGNRLFENICEFRLTGALDAKDFT